MEDTETSPERRAELRAATLARLAQERAEALARVKARTAGAAAAIPNKIAQRYAYSTDPRLAAALREKRERQREQWANREAARQLSGPRFTPYSGGRRKTNREAVSPVVTRTATVRPAETAHAARSFTQVMDLVGADRKWFATGANQ